MRTIDFRSVTKRLKSIKLILILSLCIGLFSCEIEEPIPSFNLITKTTPEEGGKIIISPQSSSYQQGSQITLTPEPNENWVFKQWEGDVQGNTTPLQLTMTSNKTVIGVFVKRDYPLNIKIEGEGTVEEKIVTNPSGREYPHGTTVELTPKPEIGWEFDSWEGDLSGNETPKNILVDGQKNVTVKFKQKKFYYTKKTITINSANFPANVVESTLRIVSGAFIYYNNEGDVFAFHPGNPLFTVGNSIETVPPVSSQILRKRNGEWEHFKEDDKAQFWGARNLKLIGDKVVVSDGNEIGEDPRQWRGNILYGTIQKSGDIDWKIVNKPNEMGYFHGVTMGDLNKDGLMDFAGTPGINHSRLNIFMQESDGVFKKRDEIINISGFYHYSPFTIEFANLFGDERDEIIIADYGGGTAPPDSDDHEIAVYAYDPSTQKYELKFKDNYPNAYSCGLGATSIKVFDANNDGIKDIAVAREGGDGGPLNWHGFEVWLGKGDGTFQYSFSSPTWNEREMQFREFVVLDANNDGLDDIIIIPFHFGSLFRNNPPCGPGTCNGIKLNHLIWLSKGDGTFEYYDKLPIVFPDVNVNFVLPYKQGNDLYFYGNGYGGSVPWPTLDYQHNIYDMRVNIDD